MVTLTSRQVALLKLLNSEEGYQTISYYAYKMGISGRTVHSDLQMIDSYLRNEHTIEIKRKRGVGIRLDGDQKERIGLIKTISCEDCINVGSIVERREAICFSLLNDESATNFRKLADYFFVGVSSITNDLQEIEKWLSHFQIVLKKDKHGTSIKGTDEVLIRRAMVSLIQGKMDRLTDSVGLHKNIDKGKNEQIIDIMTSFLSKGEIDKAASMINFMEKEMNCHINDSYYVNMMICIAVMLERQQKEQFIKQTYSEEHLIRNLHLLKTYIIAKETLEEFCVIKNKKLYEGEVQYLNQCIMGTGIDDDIGSGDVREYNPEVQRLAHRLCWFASDMLKIRLDHDPILYRGLLVHLDPMLSRIRNGIVIKNPLLEQIKEQYSAMFGLTSLLGTFLENETHLKINENEIGFLMVHFQAALERNGTSTKVIIVCPGGIGTSELVANRIKRLIPGLEIVGIYSFRDINNVNLSDVDFIISSVPLKKVGKPVVLVSPMVSVTDAKIVNNFYLDYIFTNNKEINYFHHLSTVVSGQFTFPNLNIDNKDELISFISRKLEEGGAVSSGFADSVKERENVATTDLGSNIAIPHGQGEFVNQSVVAIATLSAPIYWGKNKVSLVFLIALRIDEQKKTKSIMRDLYNLFNSPPVLDKMLKANSKKEIMSLLRA